MGRGSFLFKASLLQRILIFKRDGNISYLSCGCTTSMLSWDSHIHIIIAKASKLLGLLTRTCPLLMDVSVRRSLYLSLVKSQLLRHPSLVARSCYSEYLSGTGAEACKQVDSTHAQRRDVLQGAVDYARPTSTL